MNDYFIELKLSVNKCELIILFLMILIAIGTVYALGERKEIQSDLLISTGNAGLTM
jgi:hypothetical protein